MCLNPQYSGGVSVLEVATAAEAFSTAFARAVTTPRADTGGGGLMVYIQRTILAPRPPPHLCMRVNFRTRLRKISKFLSLRTTQPSLWLIKGVFRIILKKLGDCKKLRFAICNEDLKDLMKILKNLMKILRFVMGF